MGEVAERPKAHAWKAERGAQAPSAGPKTGKASPERRSSRGTLGERLFS